MAKSNSMGDYLARIRNQAAVAHVDETVAEPEVKVEPKREVVEASEQKQALPEKRAKQSPKKMVKATPARHRSIWTNPYPDAQPHQSTIYTCDEDALLVKQLRLKLKYSKDWMVYKYALEELAKREGLSTELIWLTH